MRCFIVIVVWFASFLFGPVAVAEKERSNSTIEAEGSANIADYPSIQAALDANPGKIMLVPAGDYRLNEPIRIRHANSGLRGPGRLIQDNPAAAVIEIRNCSGNQISGLTLTRTDTSQRITAGAIEVGDCQQLLIERLQIVGNQSAAASIRLDNCQHASVIHCLVRDYMTISIDDRTASPHYGYAFHCIDGTGIAVDGCQDVLLQSNRVLETQLRPARETKERFQLGQFSSRAQKKGSLIAQQTWDAGYVNNWHQGSGIIVTSPERSKFIRLLDNHVENAAQGIYIHADFVTITGNFVVNSFMGMKAMHGSRHIVIANNQFVRNDLWAIGLMPGAASHPADSSGDLAPQTANADGGSLIANNIISDFGHGDSHWIWDPANHTCAPIVLDHGQEPDDPPLRGVVLSGNVVAGPSLSAETSPKSHADPQPRYRFAIYVSRHVRGPRDLVFCGNYFQPGSEGVSNVPELLQKALDSPGTQVQTASE